MNKMYLLGFSELPILAKTFRNIKKFTNCYPGNEIKNKIITLNLNNLYGICSFSHKYEKQDNFVGNTFLKSHLLLTYNSTTFEEKCDYCNFEYSNNIFIKYSFEKESFDKLELQFYLINNNEISNNFHSCLPPKTQDLFYQINNIIQENKDKCFID